MKYVVKNKGKKIENGWLQLWSEKNIDVYLLTVRFFYFSSPPMHFEISISPASVHITSNVGLGPQAGNTLKL